MAFLFAKQAFIFSLSLFISLFCQKLASKRLQVKREDRTDPLFGQALSGFVPPFSAAVVLKSPESMFLILISHLYLSLTDLGQNKLGMFESINRTYWLSSLSAV